MRAHRNSAGETAEVVEQLLGELLLVFVFGIDKTEKLLMRRGGKVERRVEESYWREHCRNHGRGN